MSTFLRRLHARIIAWWRYGSCGYCPQCIAVQMAVMSRLEGNGEDCSAIH